MVSADPHEQRFADWLQTHAGILRQLSRAYAPEPADEAELHQEMLVQLWRSVPRFRAEAKPSTWIYRVCLNTGLTWQRSAKRRVAQVAAEPTRWEQETAPETGPAETEERADLMDALMRAVRALPPGERSVVVLALDGLSYREIGEVTGMTENHVGVTLTRARQKLARNMKEVSHEL
jgi:RNA polymerase sigma-70 factor (ECF subfamily)